MDGIDPIDPNAMAHRALHSFGSDPGSMDLRGAAPWPPDAVSGDPDQPTSPFQSTSPAKLCEDTNK